MKTFIRSSLGALALAFMATAGEAGMRQCNELNRQAAEQIDGLTAKVKSGDRDTAHHTQAWTTYNNANLYNMPAYTFGGLAHKCRSDADVHGQNKRARLLNAAIANFDAAFRAAWNMGY